LLGQAMSECRWLGHLRLGEISSDQLRWAKVRAKVSRLDPPRRRLLQGLGDLRFGPFALIVDRFPSRAHM
jgi:hypothetical protein